MIKRFHLLYLIYKRLLVIEEKLMTVSADVQALVDRINALPVDNGSGAAQHAEDVAALDAAVSAAEAKAHPAPPPAG